MFGPKRLILVVLGTLVGLSSAADLPVVQFRWCITEMETHKCWDLKSTLELNISKQVMLNISADCVPDINATQCMKKIEKGEADLITLDGGEIFMAGNYMVPVVAEDYGGEYGMSYYAVAVVRKNNTGFDIKSLKGRKSCHTGAHKTAGWNIPIGFLLKKKMMTMDKSCDAFKVAEKFFNKSCVPGANPSYKDLCALCDNGQPDGYCSSNGPFSGYSGAFTCMAQGYGDVAFVKHTTVSDMVAMDPAKYGKVSDYQYLCPGGGRKDIGEYKTCNLSPAPAHAVMTKRGHAQMANFKKILLQVSADYGINQTDPTQFQLFNSSRYMDKDLLFQDSTVKLVDVGEKNTYDKWLGRSYMDDLQALKKCKEGGNGDPKGEASVVHSLAVLVFSSAILACLGFSV